MHKRYVSYGHKTCFPVCAKDTTKDDGFLFSCVEFSIIYKSLCVHACVRVYSNDLKQKASVKLINITYKLS